MKKMGKNYLIIFWPRVFKPCRNGVNKKGAKKSLFFWQTGPTTIHRCFKQIEFHSTKKVSSNVAITPNHYA
jgi:hypothetical protein